MKINTDLVKKKEFAYPIKSSAIKRSQEYRVLATLRYLFPRRFDAMERAEAPDLQERENDIGIEVTSAVKESDMKVSRVFSELYHGNRSEIEKRKGIIVSNGYSFIDIAGEKVAVSTIGTSEGEKSIFQKIIQKKIEKLPQYREKFKTIGLAIILPEIPTTYAEEHFGEWASEVFKESNSLFDFIYVLSHRFCIYYSIYENISEKYVITSEETRLITTLARMTAENELCLTDIEWL